MMPYGAAAMAASMVPALGGVAAGATDEKISLGFLKSPEDIIGGAGFVCENAGQNAKGARGLSTEAP